MTDKWAKGLEGFDAVYGKGASRMFDDVPRSTSILENVEHLFGEVWTAPHMSIRDKRLLVIGATIMLGRPEVLAIQLAGAIMEGDLTDDQIEDMKMIMLFYAGAPNVTALIKGIELAKKRVEELRKAG